MEYNEDARPGRRVLLMSVPQSRSTFGVAGTSSFGPDDPYGKRLKAWGTQTSRNCFISFPTRQQIRKKFSAHAWKRYGLPKLAGNR